MQIAASTIPPILLCNTQMGHGQFKIFKMGHYPLSAILDKPGGQNVCVTIPVGAMLVDSPHTSTTLVGMVGVYWEGQHYSVFLDELFKNAEIV